MVMRAPWVFDPRVWWCNLQQCVEGSTMHDNLI